MTEIPDVGQLCCCIPLGLIVGFVFWMLLNLLSGSGDAPSTDSSWRYKE